MCRRSRTADVASLSVRLIGHRRGRYIRLTGWLLTIAIVAVKAAWARDSSTRRVRRTRTVDATLTLRTGHSAARIKNAGPIITITHAASRTAPIASIVKTKTIDANFTIWTQRVSADWDTLAISTECVITALHLSTWIWLARSRDTKRARFAHRLAWRRGADTKVASLLV